MSGFKQSGFLPRIVCSAGGAVSGVVHSTVAMFVLLYYNVALDVSAGLVSTALAIAIMFDAVSDPLVGHVSDNLRTRWGRRLPLMYIAIVPVTILFYALWNPPIGTLGSVALFIYLLVVIIALRLSMTLFDVPFNAVVPELTTGYDERTRLSVYRVAANWTITTVFVMLLYGFWLSPTPEFPNGLHNASGYARMGFVGSIIVFVLMLIAVVTLGLTGSHPHQGKVSSRTRHKWSIQVMFRAVRSVWLNPALKRLALTTCLVSLSFSIYGAMSGYMYTYFWELTTTEISGLSLMWGVGVAAGFLFAPLIYRGRDKKAVIVFALVWLGILEAVAPFLRLVGWFPDSGSTFYYSLLMCHAAADMCFYIIVIAILGSMFADLVEVREHASGNREEGTIYSAQTLVTKVSAGGGVWLVGLILLFSGFPSGVEEVSADTVRSLGIAQIVVVLACYPLAAFAVLRVPVDRENHNERLKLLLGNHESQSPGTLSGNVE